MLSISLRSRRCNGGVSVLILCFVWTDSMQSLWRRFLQVSVLAAIALLVSPVALAQSETKDDENSPAKLIQEGNRPLLSITFSGADRFMEKGKYIFDAAEHPEAYKALENFVSGTLNNLEGFNREKPFGIMGYLPVAIPPLPEFVAFVPVDSVEAATKLVERAPVVIRKDDEEGRYEVIGPNRTFPVLMKYGYAFIPLGNNISDSMLDREFPDPAQLLAGQAQQFDGAVRLDVESIPVATRTLLYGLINTGLSTQLQQRDGEPEGAYRIRRTEGERGLAALKMLIMDCQKITMGFAVAPEEQAVNIDIIIDAVEGSEMLKEIFSSAERPSYFIPLLDDDAAVSVSMSSKIADRDKEAYIEMMEGVRLEVSRLIEENKLGAVPDENSPIGQALSAVQATLEEGHADVFAQFYRDSKGKLAIVWAGRVVDGEAMNAGFADVLTRLKDIEEIKKAGELQINSGDHLGVTFHRLTFAEQPPAAVEVFGENVGMTVGIGSTAVWGVIGGDESMATLTAVMDQLEAANQSAADRRSVPNFRVILNINKLVELAETAETVSRREREAREQEAGAKQTLELQAGQDGQNNGKAPAARSGDEARNARRAEMRQRRDRSGQIFRETLKEGDDRIEIDSRLTETGARTRIRLEEGFVKIFGRLIASNLAPQAESQPAAEAAPAPQGN